MRRTIKDSRILITGASQGIGEALATQAARRGAKVVAAARQLDLLQVLADRLQAEGHPIEVVAADVTVPADRQKMVEACERAYGGLDVLVNNAGVGATGHFAEASAVRLRQIMEVNLFGTTETTRACLPLLKKGDKPAIVNISSIAGKRAIPARSEYSASKFAVQGFTQAIRAELAKDGIDVVCVCPGLTQTNFSRNMLEQKARMAVDHMRGMTPEAVAAATLRAIERGTGEVVLTFNGNLMALVSRFLPRFADWVAAAKVRSLFRDEIEERKRQKAAPPPPEAAAAS